MSADSDPRDDAQVEARLSLVLQRLDRRLTEQETEMVRERIARQQSVLHRLRAVPLGNGDEPAPGFDPSFLGRIEVDAT